jgi:DNA-binding MarR family transcriptional regulator
MNMEIRDTRNGEWFWVYKALLADPHLSQADKLTYGSLATFSGYERINPGFKEIARRANLSVRAAKMGVKALLKTGYLKIIQGGGRHRTNIYLLLKRPKGCKFCTVSETVQNTTGNGALFAPQVDKEIDNNILCGPVEKSVEKTKKDDFKRMSDRFAVEREKTFRKIRQDLWPPMSLLVKLANDCGEEIVVRNLGRIREYYEKGKTINEPKTYLISMCKKDEK